MQYDKLFKTMCKDIDPVLYRSDIKSGMVLEDIGLEEDIYDDEDISNR